jgi:hypothetical protein
MLLLKPIGHLLEAMPRGGVTLAHEGIDGTIGAANALMIASRNASTLHEWYARYRDFSDSVWNGFSVRLPMELAIRDPGSVRLLGYTAFYWPPWNPWGVAQIYRAARCALPASMGIHLWETKMWASLMSKLTPERVKRRDTCFTRLAAAVLDGSFDFSSATLDDGAAAETTDTLLAQTDLARLLDAAPDAEKRSAPSAAELPKELQRFLGQPGSAYGGCTDAHASCAGWASKGECALNSAYMERECRRSCKLC